MKKFVIGIALLVLIYQFATRESPVSSEPAPAPSTAVESVVGAASTDALSQAFEQHRSNVQVQGEGTVEKVLKDDNDGSRHQRMIVRVADGHTILIAHNIDLAPRVAGLEEGDTVSFAGEYEWNSKGGVVHWTHRDPNGSHVAGWIRHDGQMYQ